MYRVQRSLCAAKYIAGLLLLSAVVIQVGMKISKGQSTHAFSRGRRISPSASLRTRLTWVKAIVDDGMLTLLWPLHNNQFDCWDVVHKSTHTGFQLASDE